MTRAARTIPKCWSSCGDHLKLMKLLVLVSVLLAQGCPSGGGGLHRRHQICVSEHIRYARFFLDITFGVDSDTSIAAQAARTGSLKHVRFG